MAWKSWEAIAYRPIAFKWRHSWSEKAGDAFVCFDGDRQVGQIFLIDEPWSMSRWFWVVAAEGRSRKNWPTAGFEETIALAAKRLEWVYEHLQSGKPRYVD